MNCGIYIPSFKYIKNEVYYKVKAKSTVFSDISQDKRKTFATSSQLKIQYLN